MALSAFIDDGYTETETLPATDKYPAVTITFRPMLRQELDRVTSRGRSAAELEGKPGVTGEMLDRANKEATEFASAALARHIKSWDVKDSKGNTVEITAANMAKVQRHLFEQFLMTVGRIGVAKEIEEINDQKNSEPGSVSS